MFSGYDDDPEKLLSTSVTVFSLLGEMKLERSPTESFDGALDMDVGRRKSVSFDTSLDEDMPFAFEGSL